MRKFIVKLMILVLCLSMTVGVYAAEEILVIPDISVQQGQTVYVAVTLTESVVGDSMGVIYSYDKEVLEALPDSSTWGKQGMLQDFSQSDSGVWAIAQAQDLKGTVCVLAFRVKKDVTLTETTVTCTVTVKSDAEVVSTYTATGRVYALCDHQYSQWKNGGDLSHSQICEHCGQEQTQTHIWNDGVISEHPTDNQKQLLVYTCTVCGATRQQEIANQGSQKPTEPPRSTEPPAETPTEPELTTFPPEEPETATRPPQQYPENNESQRPTEGQNPNTQSGQTGNQANSGNQNTAGNQNPSGGQGNADNQTGSGQLTDYNQGTSNNQNDSGNQTGSGQTTNPNQGTNSNQNTSGNQTGSVSQNQNNQTDHNGQTDDADGVEPEDEHHDHVHDESASSNQAPVAIPIPEGVEIPDHTHETPTEPVHDHVHETPGPEQTGVSLLALLVAVLLVAVAVVLIMVLMKRIKRK